MKKEFEIEVVRTYTTTIYVQAPDYLTSADVERITIKPTILDTSNRPPHEEREEYIYDEIWEQIGEQELEQMDTDFVSVKAKEYVSK